MCTTLPHPDEVDSTWTLKNLQDLVTNAESHGGGWVQLTFHHIAIGTDPTLTISPPLFEQFVTWLSARTANGTTVVQTVAQALGQTTPPPPANTGRRAAASRSGRPGILAAVRRFGLVGSGRQRDVLQLGVR